MEQNTIKNLQAQLYVEELRLEYEKRDFWFTKNVETECNNWIKRTDRKEDSLSDRELELIDAIKKGFKHKDFVIGLLYSYSLAKLEGNSNPLASTLKNSLSNAMPLGINRLTNQSVYDLYENEDMHIAYAREKVEFNPLIDNIVETRNLSRGESEILEIGTSFFEISDKIAYDDDTYINLKCLSLIDDAFGEIYLADECSKVQEKKYSLILIGTTALLMNEKDGRYAPWLEKLDSYGHIVIVSDLIHINHPALKQFRKKIVEESLLKLYDCPIITDDDTSITYGHDQSWCVISSSDNKSSDFHFVTGYKYRDCSTGLFSTHRRLSSSQLKALDYDFDKASKIDDKAESDKAVKFSDIFQIENQLVDCKGIEGCVYKSKKAIDIFSFKCDSKDFTKRVMKGEMYKITKPSIVVTVTENDGWWFTNVIASDNEPLFVSPYCIVLYYDEQKLLPEYIYLMQEQGIFKKMMSNTNTKAYEINVSDVLFRESGELIKVYPKDNIYEFKDYLLPIPTINEQSLAISNAKMLQEASAKKIDSLELLIQKKKSEYIDEVRSRKHDMMPHLRQIDSTNKLMDFRIKNIDEYDKDTFVAEMQKRLYNQREALKSLYKSLEFFSRESRFGCPEIINLDKYLFDNYFEVEGQIGNISYLIDIDVDYQSLKESGFAISRRPPIIEERMTLCEIKDMLDKTPYYEKDINVYMAQDDLDRLCDNIIQNAITHGFTDPNRNDYNVWIDLSANADKNMFQIDFRNNGNPFPTGMDKESYGTRGVKAGMHQGSGEGGYVVKSIVEHYGGDYEVISYCTDKGYVNIVRIFLPILR